MIEIISIEKFKSVVFDFTTHDSWFFDKKLPIILNFFADWCGPCHMFAPILNEIAAEYDGQVNVYKINIDHTPEIAALFDIKSVPTTLFLNKHGEPIMTSGVMPKDTVIKVIKDVFKMNNAF